MNYLLQKARLAGWAILMALAFAAQPGAAITPHSSNDKERELINTLLSDAPPDQKALVCKKLAVYGTDHAVPALAPLLADPNLASWARIALEAIPGRAAGNALLQAMDQLDGKLLVGVINSIGVRRDTKATAQLVIKLKHRDAEVASAAALALGRIGGKPAAKALLLSLPTASENTAPAIAEGCVRCAERMLARGASGSAIELYDAVRTATVPKPSLIEATRGAILARGTKGIPLLLDQLRSEDKSFFGIGLRTARELPGRKATEALKTELSGASPKRQPLLLLALADRGDDTALPTIVAAGQSGTSDLRIAAIGALDRRGNVSTLPVLLDAAADPDARVAQAAMAALTRLSGETADAELLARLARATGKPRQVLIQLAGKRHLEAALPTLLAAAEDQDALIRNASLKALAEIGNETQATRLVQLLQRTSAPADRADIETSLVAISGRHGSACLPHLQTLLGCSDAPLRLIALHALAAAGGSGALSAVAATVHDRDETVSDEAVRTLCSWPNTWPEDGEVAAPLFNLAQTAPKPLHQTLALRGYLQYLKEYKKLGAEEKTAKLTALLPQISQPEQKRAALAVLGEIPAPGALTLLCNLATDPAIREDACSAILGLTTGQTKGLSADQRKAALQTVLDKSQTEETRKKAEQALKAIK